MQRVSAERVAPEIGPSENAQSRSHEVQTPGYQHFVLCLPLDSSARVEQLEQLVETLNAQSVDCVHRAGSVRCARRGRLTGEPQSGCCRCSRLNQRLNLTVSCSWSKTARLESEQILRGGALTIAILLPFAPLDHHLAPSFLDFGTAFLLILYGVQLRGLIWTTYIYLYLFEIFSPNRL